jgi:hypothetical protein
MNRAQFWGSRARKQALPISNDFRRIYFFKQNNAYFILIFVSLVLRRFDVNRLAMNFYRGSRLLRTVELLSVHTVLVDTIVLYVSYEYGVDSTTLESTRTFFTSHAQDGFVGVSFYVCFDFFF